jgi:hypothetical protein
MDPDIADSMDQLRRRVEQQRAAGVYGLDDVHDMVANADSPDMVRALAPVMRRAEIGPAPRAAAAPVHGVRGVAEKARTAARDVMHRPADDVADRATAFNTAVVAYLAELAGEVAALREEVDRLSERTADRD